MTKNLLLLIIIINTFTKYPCLLFRRGFSLERNLFFPPTSDPDQNPPGRYVAVMHVGRHHNSSSAPVALKTHQSSESQYKFSF